MNWVAWIRVEWPRLSAGAKVVAPAWLPSPPVNGFTALAVATPQGQCADWGLSLNDGSRIHVHEFATGERIAHRDEHDPGQGLGRALAHLAFETWVGPAALLALGLAILASLRK